MSSSVILSYRLWSQSPDDIAHLQNCGALDVQGAVSDQRCADKNRYICEYSLTPGTRENLSF